MQWVLQQIGAAFQAVFQVLIVKPIGFILTELAKAVFSIVTMLLKLTIFKPFTLTPAANGSNIVAGAAETVWTFMAALSVAVALIALVWAAFTNTWGSIAGRSQFARSGWADVLEGVGIWLLVLIGGYGFLGMLLDATNAVTTGFVNLAMSYQFQSVNAATLGAGVVAAILTNWLWPSMLLILAGFMVWAVVVWVMRMVDLVVYTGLLPLTAAFAITGNKQAWQWNWSEAMGAVFSQVAMAIMWWIAWLFIGGKLVHVNGSFGNDVVRLLMGLAAMTLVAKAPQMLQSITGHRHAGVGGLAMAAAGGYMVGRAAMTAAKITPLGQAAGKMTEAVAQRSQNKLNQWADKGPIGSGPVATALSGMVGGGLQRAVAAGRHVLGGALNTQTGQTVTSGAQQLWSTVANRAPGVAQAARTVGSGTARAASTVSGAVSRRASSATSMVLQPSRALGQAALHADARTHSFGAANAEHGYAVRAGALGYDAVVRQNPIVQSSETAMQFAQQQFERVRRTNSPDTKEYQEARRSYDAAQQNYDQSYQVAYQQTVERIMGAPHGANAYQQARDHVQQRGPRPAPTSYA